MKYRLGRKILCLALAAGLVANISACGQGESVGSQRSITVFNYGEYIDYDMVLLFEEETGIHVNYEEALTPEELYAKYKSGVIDYDLVCSSDYMIRKLMDEGELLECDFSSMENLDLIGEEFWELAATFDPGNKYAMPYFWGTVGILYDTTRVDGEITGWSDLFGGGYNNEIIMQDSMRDSFMAALKYLGYSTNTTDEEELQEALALLKEQKKDVQAYMVDAVRDEIIAGNSITGVIYSGEALVAMDENEDLDFCLPEEGSNIWIDCFAITKQCQDYDAAVQFLEFLNRPEVAYANFDYIWYSTPNEGCKALMDPEDLEDEILNPNIEDLTSCEVYMDLPQETLDLYSEMWKELKAEW